MRQVGVMGAVLALLALSAPPAISHSWGPGNTGGPSSTHGEGVFYADSTSHTFCYLALDSITTAAAEDARVNALDAPTNIRTSFDCSTSTVDVVVHDDPYVQSWYGLYDCLLFASTEVCERADVLLNTRTVGTQQARRSKTLCHEFGHSVGLRHFDLGSPGANNSEPSCMVSGYSTWTRYSGHERYTSHIDGRY